MAFSPPDALAAGDTLTAAWLNALISATEDMFDHGLATDEDSSANFSYPLKLEGPIDFDGHSIVGVASYAQLIFAGGYATLQEAVDALDSNGGIVLLEAKVYEINAALDLTGTDGDKSNVLLIGVGDGSVIRPSSTFNSVAGCYIRLSKTTDTTSSGMGLYNLKIDGGLRSGPTSFVLANNTDNLRISNVTFVNGLSQQYCIDLSRCSNASVTECTFDCGYTTSGAIRLWFTRTDSKNLLIKDNIVENPLNAGFHLDAIPGTIVKNNIIQSSDASRADLGMFVSNLYAGDAIERLVISNNILVKETSDIATNGIHLSAWSASTTQYIVTGNTIVGYGGMGIYIRGDTGTVTDHSRFIIEENNIRNVGSHGICLDRTGVGDVDESSQSIQANIVNHCNRLGSAYPIYLYNNSTDNDSRSYYNCIIGNLCSNDGFYEPGYCVYVSTVANIKHSLMSCNSYDTTDFTNHDGSNQVVMDDNLGWT